jgi:hypothetical protein
MPPVRTKKVSPEEQQIAKAIKDIQDGILKNASVAARHYYMPYSKLYHRLQGRSAAESNSRLNKVLSVEQENVLLLYIDRYNKLGCQYKYKYIEVAANLLLFVSGSFYTISVSWISRFIKRTGILYYYSKPLSVQQKAAQNRLILNSTLRNLGSSTKSFE